MIRRATPTRQTEVAFAKVNLALHVRRRRPDGYHDLETVFAFCEHGDIVTAAAADEVSLTIDGPYATGLTTVDNLVVRAARAMGVTAALTLTKNLPVASGIGGGSADAAAAIRALHRLTGAPVPPFEAQLRLGADVPACVVGQTMRGEGVGEKLTPITPVTGLPILLVNPHVALSTATVFNAWDGVDRGPLGAWRYGRNDLEAPARRLVPEIGALLEWLTARHDVTVARMSGSGATCFALFATLEGRDQAMHDARASYPEHWLMASTLR